MDHAIKHHFNKEITSQIKLTGGWNVWLLVLSDGKKPCSAAAARIPQAAA